MNLRTKVGMWDWVLPTVPLPRESQLLWMDLGYYAVFSVGQPDKGPRKICLGYAVGNQ